LKIDKSPGEIVLERPEPPRPEVMPPVTVWRGVSTQNLNDFVRTPGQLANRIRNRTSQARAIDSDLRNPSVPSCPVDFPSGVHGVGVVPLIHKPEPSAQVLVDRVRVSRLRARNVNAQHRAYVRGRGDRRVVPLCQVFGPEKGVAHVPGELPLNAGNPPGGTLPVLLPLRVHERLICEGPKNIR